MFVKSNYRGCVQNFQIGHKYVERRVLVAETCCALLPKIPPALRNSLVFSILHQLIADDKDVQVK
jgi:hypothetical protein